MHISPTLQRAARNKVAVAIFVACCLLSSARLVVDAPNPTNLKVDDIAQRSDQRFGALKELLPPRGIIGYIGESGGAGIPDYYLAQYALAPLVLDRSSNHPLVVGNFPNSPPETPPENLQLMKDFGNGVLLFSSKDAK